MSIFDMTPAGAYMNAIQAAYEKDRRAALRFPAVEQPARRTDRFFSVPKATLRLFFGTAKTTRSLQSTTDLRSRAA